VASIIHQYTVVVPANTTVAAPYTRVLATLAEQVRSVDLDVPPGPQGLMGFVLANSGQQVIPFEVGQYIIWDNYRDSWDLDGYADMTQWSVIGYNLDGANSHEVVVRFHNDALTIAPAAAVSVNIIQGTNDLQPAAL
jgi:hypothetical protein